MALFLGLSRSAAARFSFLLSTPIIFGACVLKASHLIEAFQSFEGLIGILVAAISGFLSINYLMKLVQNFSYRVFSYYRFVFSLVVIVLYFLR